MAPQHERRKPRPHLRHDAARRRAVAGDLAQHRREGRDRPAARAARRRRDRGRLPDHLARRLRGGRGDLARGRGAGHLRPRPHPQGRHRRRLGGDPRCRSGRGSTPSSRPPTSTSSTSCRPTARTSRARPGPRWRWPSPTAPDVEFSPMDATRADVEFTAEVCAIAVEEGATVINIPDTVGYTTPEEYAAYFRRLYELVPGLREVETSVHCHDDLGLAVANSYAGVLAGARQVECAVNGIGERAGNCSLEEIVMLVRTREDVHGLDHRGQHPRARPHQPHGLPPDRLRDPAEQGGGRAQRLRPRVRDPPGRRAEGAHAPTRSWTRPRSASSRTRSCSASTPAATRCATRWSSSGFKVEGNALNAAFKRFKEVADRKKQVTALDLEAIVSDEMREREDAHELAWFEVEAGSRREPLARVAVKLPSGEEVGRRVERRRPGRRDLPRDPEGGRDRVRAAPVHGRGGDRGRGRPRRGHA